MAVNQSRFVEKGYTIYNDNANMNGNVGWYACKKIDAPCRPCETNISCQIVIRPFVFDNLFKFEVSIRGQHDSIWYDLKAYSLTEEDLDNLSVVEVKVLAAWNGISNAPLLNT